MPKITVLITGTGGLGQEILKAVRRIEMPKKIICVDAKTNSPGLYRGDVAYLVPKSNQRQFVPTLLRICRSEKVNVIFVGTQEELPILSRHKEKFANLGTKVIVTDYPALKVAADKYLLTQRLKDHQITIPDTVLLSDQNAVKVLINKHGFPLFSKARNKSGSKEAKIVKNLADLNALPKENILQQYLGKDNEFTAGCYLTQENKFFFILLKRQMFEGTGQSGEVVPFRSPEARKYCYRIVSKLSLYGPTNIQLKIILGQPILFEINPRFSSTTSIQAGLGINFAHLAIAEALNLPLPQMKYSSQLVLRYFNEVYLPLQQVRNLNQRHKLNAPKSSLEQNY
jgi:carbamoyl-phosphate synthase large subunit